MPGFFSVEHSAVSGHAGNLQDAVGRFETNSREFESAMQDLLSKIEGGARNSLMDLEQQWLSASAQVNRALAQLGGRTEDVASQYQTGETEQEDEVRAQTGRMDFHTAESTTL